MRSLMVQNCLYSPFSRKRTFPAGLLRILCNAVGLFLVPGIHATAQTLIPEKRVFISRPVAVSVNPYGNVLVSDEKGTIRIYDTVGTVINTFSPPRVAGVTLIEAWQSLRIFVFYPDLQEYLLLDRFLTPLPMYPKSFRRATDEVGFVRLATPAADGQLWLFDDIDFSLKKFSPSTQHISLNVPLELVLGQQDYQFTFIREYQNLVFLNDHLTGILVFDNLGNFQRKIARPPTSYIGFIKDEIYFVSANQVFLINLYTEEIRKLALPAGIVPLHVVITAQKVYVLTDRELIVCSMHP